MNLWNDLRYGLRTLRASPGFALASILTLAFGIGATTAVFSISDALLWKPVHLPHQESLVMLVGRVPGEPNYRTSVSAPDVEDIAGQSKSLSGVAGWWDGLVSIGGSGGEPQRALRASVGANFFDVVGVEPAFGRAFRPGEDQPGREREAVLSHRFWQSAFGGDPSVVGRTILVDDQDYVVTGVMPDGFDFPLATQVWTPLALTAVQRGSRGSRGLIAAARLKPGHSVEEASAELDAIGRRLAAMYPNTNKDRRFALWSVSRFLVKWGAHQYVLLILGAVIFVLLIACVNVANLQFARATGRWREVAVRAALGASRGRVMAQLVTESVLLSLAGAAAGLLVAEWGIGLMRDTLPPEIARFILGWREFRLDGRTLAFTAATAVACGILAGLIPAWQCSRPDLASALKEGGRGSSLGHGRQRLRHALVAGEISLAVVLLVGAGLMVRGFRNQVAAGGRFEPARVLTMHLAITENKYPEGFQQAAFYREVVERVSALPGVQSAAVASAMPYSDYSDDRDITIEGVPTVNGDVLWAMCQSVSPKFFATLRVPLRAGRLLNDGDTAEALPVAVVNGQFAKQQWKGLSPIGRRLKLGMADSKGPWLTVVGVAGNIPHSPFDREIIRMVFLPQEQAPRLRMDLGVRTANDPLSLAHAILSAIRSVDPEVPVSDMGTLEKAIHDNAIALNYVAVIMGVFGVLAWVLAAIGVYGVMAYLVSGQTHEIGIRMALGAPRAAVLAAVFRRGMVTSLAGLAVGIPAAYWLATRLVASLIYGVAPTDPVTFVGIPLTLLATAALAIYIPARRATRIDPIVALRCE
jgi:putative ABC transport system permease protein